MTPAELARYEAGLSIEEAAARAGVSQRTLTRLERGGTKPSAATARAIADVYGITVAQLLGIDVDAGELRERLGAGARIAEGSREVAERIAARVDVDGAS